MRGGTLDGTLKTTTDNSTKYLLIRCCCHECHGRAVAAGRANRRWSCTQTLRVVWEVGSNDEVARAMGRTLGMEGASLWGWIDGCITPWSNAYLWRSMAFLTENPGENLAFVAARRGVARLLPRRDFWRWTQYILFIPKGQRGGRVDVMMERATCQGEALRSVEVEAARD